MQKDYREGWRWWLALSVAASAPGCRDAEPHPALNHDLGSGRTVLLPTASEWHDPQIANGQSDWHPFRKPSGDAPAEANAAAGDQLAGLDEEIEAEIRDLVAEYNEVVADGAVDELIEYHVPDQQDRLKQVFVAAGSMKESYGAIGDQLNARLPDASERIASAVALVEKGAGLQELVLKDLTVSSDTEVAAAVGGSWITETCRFLVVDEEWYIEATGLPEEAQLQADVAADTARIQGWLDALQSGQTSAESILAQIESAGEALRADVAAPQIGAAGDNEAAAASGGQPNGEAPADATEGG